MQQTECDNQTIIDGAFEEGGTPPLGPLQPNVPATYHEVAPLHWDDHTAMLPLMPMMQVLEPQSSGVQNAILENNSQPPMTGPSKELMKLRKKLREIEKIESLIAAGDTKIDPLQRAKVEKKADLLSKLELAESTSKEQELLEQAHMEQEQNSSLVTDNMQIFWTPVLIPVNFTTEGSASQPEQSLQDQPDIHPHMEFDTCDTEMQARHLEAVAQAQMCKQHIAASQLQEFQQSQLPYQAGPQHRVLSPNWEAADLLKCLESDNESLVEALAALQGWVLALSLESIGCRAVQLALQLADLQTATKLAAELRGHVQVAIKSPHGNYVIQQVIEILPIAQCKFIVEELQGFGAAMARHRFGCRILCRLLEHCADEAGLLIKEVLEEAVSLCRHTFGHHVIESILEHGTVEQRQKIIVAVCTDLYNNLSNRNASSVIEKVLIYCAAEEHSTIVDALLASSPEVLAAALRGRLGSQFRKVSPKLASIASLRGLDGIRVASGRPQASKQWKRSWKGLGHEAATPLAVAAM